MSPPEFVRPRPRTHWDRLDGTPSVPGPWASEPSCRSAAGARLGRVVPVAACLCVLISINLPPVARAQDLGRWSIGATAGSPGGLTARYSAASRPEAAWSPQAFTALLSFDLDNYALLNLHAVTEHDLPDSPITVFAGPGLAVGVDGHLAMAGIAAVFGLKFYRARFEIFMQGHPRLMLVPGPRAFPGAGVGFRFHP